MNYNLGFISIFLPLYCFSFFRASGHIDFAKEKSKLEEMRKKFTIASGEIGKLKQILNRIKIERTFETNDSDMKSLALLIYHLRNTCFKREDLDKLSGLEMRLDSYLACERKIVDGLSEDLDKNRNYSDKSKEKNEMVVFLSKVLENKNNFSTVSNVTYTEYRETFNNSLEAFGYGTDLNSFANKYFQNKYWNHGIRNRKEEITFAERKQLWNIIDGCDIMWDTICKIDINGNETLDEYYKMSRFSELLSKVFPKNGDDYILNMSMRILNKKIFLKNLLHDLNYGTGLLIEIDRKKKIEEKIKEYLKKYEAIIAIAIGSSLGIYKSSHQSYLGNLTTSNSDSKTDQKSCTSNIEVRSSTDRPNSNTESSDSSTEEEEKLDENLSSETNYDSATSLESMPFPFLDISVERSIMDDSESFLEHYFLKKVKNYSFFWLAKKGYNMELLGINEENNLHGEEYKFSDFMNNEVGKNRQVEFMDGSSIQDEEIIITPMDTQMKGVFYRQKSIHESRGLNFLKKMNTAKSAGESEMHKLTEDRDSIRGLLNSNLSVLGKVDDNPPHTNNNNLENGVEKKQNSEVSDENIVIEETENKMDDNDIYQIGTEKSKNVKKLEKEIDTLKLEIKKLENEKEKKPWEWKLSLMTEKKKAFNYRDKIEKWEAYDGRIVVSTEGNILECDCELFNINKRNKKSSARLKVENGESVEFNRGGLPDLSYKKSNEIIIEAYMSSQGRELVKREFDISTIDEKLTIVFREGIGFADIKFYADISNNMKYKAGHSEIKININYVSYAKKRLTLLEDKIKLKIAELKIKDNKLKKEIKLVNKIVKEYENKERAFKERNVGFLRKMSSLNPNRYTDIVTKMIEVKSDGKKVDSSSLDFLSGNHKVTEIDSKIHGLMLSTADSYQESFMKECRKEYKRKKRKKRKKENWETVKKKVLRQSSSPEIRENIRAVCKKKIAESKKSIDSVIETRVDLLYNRDRSKELNLVLENLSKEVELISNNMKNRSVPIYTEIASELSRNSNMKCYDKKPVLRDTADMLKKIKNRLGNQFSSFGGDINSVNRGINILPDNHGFSDCSKREDIFYQIKSNNQDSKYLYKASNSGIFRNFQKGIIYPLYFLGIDFSTIYGLFDSISSSKIFSISVMICNFFLSCIAIFFVSAGIYDFYCILTAESKKKKRKKGKKLSHLHTLRKLMYKTSYRVHYLFSFLKSKKVKKKKKKRRRKKIKRR